MSIFCDQCGKENDDNTDFCIYCGNVLDDVVEEETPEVVQPATAAGVAPMAGQAAQAVQGVPGVPVKKKKRKGLIIAIIAIVVLALAGGAVAGYFFFFKKSDASAIKDVEITDMQKLCKYDYSDAGEKGWYIEPDEDGDYIVDGKSIKVTCGDEVEEHRDELGLYFTLENKDNADLTNLKNGDKLTVKANYSEEVAEELKLNIKDKEKTISIDGLSDRFNQGEAIPSQIVERASSEAYTVMDKYAHDDKKWHEGDIDGALSAVMYIYVGKEKGKTDTISFLYRVDGVTASDYEAYEKAQDAYWDDEIDEAPDYPDEVTLYYVVGVENVKRDFMTSSIKTSQPYLCGSKSQGKYDSDSAAIQAFEKEVTDYKYTKLNRNDYEYYY